MMKRRKWVCLFCAAALLFTLALPMGAAASPDDGHEHVYEEIPGTRKDPTCTECGAADVRCTLCGYEEHHVLNALGHKFISDMEVPNLFGVVTRTCERCGESFKCHTKDYKDPPQETEPPLGPSKYDDLTDAEKNRIGEWNTAPDPEQSGLKIVGKSDLSDYDHPECRCPVTDEKHGSTHVNSYISGDATCTQWGWEAQLPCIKCGELYSSSMNKSINAALEDKQITAKEAAEQREKYAWDFRYTTPPHGHKYDNPSREGYPSPTCATEGLWRVHCDYAWGEGCTDCYYEVAPKLGHDYELQKTEILNDQNEIVGYTAKVVCQRCGDTQTPSIYGTVRGLKNGEQWDALGCQVTFTNDATGEEIKGVCQNEAAGRDYFAVLPAGAYTMTVTADGYRPRTYKVKIREGKQQEGNVLLNATGEYDETGFLDIEKEAVVSLPAETYVETGEPITPTVTVKDGDETLVEGVDYTLEYSDNVSWGYGYAKIKGIGAYTGHYNAPFHINPKPKDEPGSSFVSGDVDGDGKISSADARLALRCSVKLENYEEDSAQYLACDVNFDGKVTSADARLILRASVGLEDAGKWKKA